MGVSITSAMLDYHKVSNQNGKLITIYKYMYMGVSIVIGVAHSWMVDNGTYHLEMDDDWGGIKFQETSMFPVGL